MQALFATESAGMATEAITQELTNSGACLLMFVLVSLTFIWGVDILCLLTRPQRTLRWGFTFMERLIA